MTKFPQYLLSAIFLSTILSPFVGTTESSDIIPNENMYLVDKRLQLVYQNPDRASELGLAPAPDGQISLIAQVESLDSEHYDFIHSLGGIVTSSFSRFNTVGFILPFDKVPDVTYLPDLEWLEADVLFYPSLDNSVESIGTSEIWDDFGFKGEDTTIAILDTGVDFEHESLDDLDDNPNTHDPKISVDSNGMLGFYNANTDKEYPDEQPHDSGNHGTHCAGIAAGTGGPSGTYSGVAPKANLVGVIALDGGSGDEQDLLRAVNWTITNKDRFSIDVMSLSLGGPVVIPGATNTGSSSISRALDVAVEEGIVTVVAIGNGNLGLAAHPGSASYPGDSVKAITVGSVNDDHNREIYSSRGPTGDGRLKPDVMAPGGAIMSASAGSGDGYVSFSGTSMATPHVAGVAALMLQANPAIAPTPTTDYVKQIMRETSDHKVPLDIDCGEVYSPNNCYGWGTVDLVGAVSRAQDLESTKLLGPTGIQTLTNETFKAGLSYTKTEYTNRGKDGGSTSNFLLGNDLPDSVDISIEYSSQWPKPTKISVDAGSGPGVSGEINLEPVIEVGENWLIQATINYTGQVSSGSTSTSSPHLEVDIQAPDFNQVIPVKAHFTLNDMKATNREVLVSSFTDLPDLSVEEIITPILIVENTETLITARVVNQGPGQAIGFQVSFLSDGEKFASVTNDGVLNPNEAVNLQSIWIPDIGTHVLQAVIENVSPQDEDISNQYNQITVEVEQYVDNQEPLVFIREPYSNETVSGVIDVKGTASDNNGVEFVEVRIVPNTWQRANGLDDWIWVWNTSLDLNGRYTIQARSFDGLNYSKIYSVEVEVTNADANRRPTAKIESSSYEAYVNEKIIFSGNFSSDDSSIVRYNFDFGDGKSTDWVGKSWIEYYFEVAGNYTVTLNVEDDEGVMSSFGDTIEIRVKELPVNNKPLAKIYLPLSANSYSTDKPVRLSSQGSLDLDEGQELSFSWYSSIDGHLYTTPIFFVEVFLSDGVHVITLEVIDSLGASDLTSVEIRVTLPPTSFDEESPLLYSVNFLVVVVLVCFVSLRGRF